jgi:hypothetical protein
MDGEGEKRKTNLAGEQGAMDGGRRQRRVCLALTGMAFLFGAERPTRLPFWAERPARPSFLGPLRFNWAVPFLASVLLPLSRHHHIALSSTPLCIASSLPPRHHPSLLPSPHPPPLPMSPRWPFQKSLQKSKDGTYSLPPLLLFFFFSNSPSSQKTHNAPILPFGVSSLLAQPP